MNICILSFFDQPKVVDTVSHFPIYLYQILEFKNFLLEESVLK